MTTLTALLAERLAAEPDAVAFVETDREWTVADFDALVDRAAHWLVARGVGPGDRVALWCVNRPEWLALCFASSRLGAATVAVNTRYRAAELAHIVGLAGARLLVTQRAFRGIDFPAILGDLDPAALPMLATIAILDRDATIPATLIGRPVIDCRLVEVEAGAAGAGAGAEGGRPDLGPAPGPVADRSDPGAEATLFATSGTTKGPKLVVQRQQAAARHARHCAAALGLDASAARLAAVMPFCGTYGLTAALAAFAGRAPVVIIDHFEPTGFARRLVDEAITHLFCTDDMLEKLAAVAPGDAPFPAARLFGFAAFSPGAAATARRLTARGWPLFGLYGSSEVWALFSTQPASLPAAERTLGGGRPNGPDAEVRIRDADSGRLLGPDEIGEIELKSSMNFVGYLGNPAATADAILADGFFRTGDVGYRRADGSFVYLNRRDDAIRLAGFLVDPVEIEVPIKTLAGVADVQVVAVPIDGRQRAVAFVIPAESATPVGADAILAASAGLMAPYRAPVRVWFVAAFPTTAGANGTKIQRGRLREMALERLAAETPPG